MNKFWLKIFITILIFGAGFLIIWLILQNIGYYDQIKIDAVLGQDQPMISSLGPEPRVKLEPDYQAILASPVYFDLRVMPWFSQAQIFLIFKEVGGSKLEGIGRHLGPGFNYAVQPPVLVKGLSDGWYQAVFDFDLANIYSEKNIFRFLISTLPSQTDEESEVRIRDFKIILSK